jgi:Ca2+-dependent lipid-binding protein
VHLKLSFNRPPTTVIAAGEDLAEMEAGGEAGGKTGAEGADSDNEEEGDTAANELHVTVVQGRRLEVKDHSLFGGGSSDPQVRLKIVGFEQQKTPFIRKNLNPVWNSRHVFPAVVDNALSLVVIVEDHNDIKTPDFMGKISIPLNQFNDKKPIKRWYKLRNKAMEADGVDRGEVELLIHWKFNIKVRSA